MKSSATISRKSCITGLEMPSKEKRPIRDRKAIMIRPDPELLAAMVSAAAKEGISVNRLALEIIETSGRLGAKEAAGYRAEIEASVVEVEASVRRLRLALS